MRYCNSLETTPVCIHLYYGKQTIQEMESCCGLVRLVIGLTKCEYSIITKPGELERRAGADRSDLSDRNAASLYHSTSRATNISCANYAPLSMDQLDPNIIHPFSKSTAMFRRGLARFHQSLPRKCVLYLKGVCFLNNGVSRLRDDE